MLSLQKPKKRIVTKRQYLANLSRKAGTSSFGLMLLFCCLIGVITTAIFLLSFPEIMPGGAENLLIVLVAALAGLGTLYLGYLGKRTLKEARQIEAGIPLTRSNAGDLPADESLVRASAQSLLPQQVVLLRPAIETDDTPAEQLLRPS